MALVKIRKDFSCNMGIIPDKYFSEITRWFKKGNSTYIPDGSSPARVGWLALSPLIVFLLLYMGTSAAVGDFYKVPISAAFLVASVYAMFISLGKTAEDKIAIFSEGAGNKNVLLMIWIFILAGAFASTAKEIGSIEATVNLALKILPGNMIYAGLFIAACFISMAIGTSVGTIVALVPVATGIAAQTGTGVAFMTGIVASGAFFGDNLSFISDTTIAATRTQNCKMNDKFKANIMIAAPAAVIVTIIYLYLGRGVSAIADTGTIQWLKILPYIIVIGLAISGMNVASVLVTGIALNAVIGIFNGSFGFEGWLGCIGGGISGMGELIIVTMLAGGMLELIKVNGGLDFITHNLTKHIKSKRGAEFSIAGIVSLANICTANNTIAIITTGRIAKDITQKFGLDKRKTASILDTFSCLIQGMLPYGAQLLMASGLAGISSVSIIGHLYYPFALGGFAILSILIRYPRKYS